MYVCACVWSLGGREFSDAIPVIKSAIAYRPNADNYCRLSRVRAYTDFAPNGDFCVDTYVCPCAQALEGAGNIVEALMQVNVALTLDPNFKPASQRLEALEAKLSNTSSRSL